MKKYGIYIPNEGLYLIVLCSKWCKSCTLLSTILEKFRDKGIINLREIDIGDNSKLTKVLNIKAIPALIFFKNGKLLHKNIELNGEIFVNKGVMIGAFNEFILKEVIKQI
ncbi:MAG: thioredoxin family protein [Promethearchaeota archaeon]